MGTTALAAQLTGRRAGVCLLLKRPMGNRANLSGAGAFCE